MHVFLLSNPPIPPRFRVVPTFLKGGEGGLKNKKATKASFPFWEIKDLRGLSDLIFQI
jgi:hypothetical protein